MKTQNVPVNSAEDPLSADAAPAPPAVLALHPDGVPLSLEVPPQVRLKALTLSLKATPDMAPFLRADLDRGADWLSLTWERAAELVSIHVSGPADCAVGAGWSWELMVRNQGPFYPPNPRVLVPMGSPVACPPTMADGVLLRPPEGCTPPDFSAVDLHILVHLRNEPRDLELAWERGPRPCLPCLTGEGDLLDAAPLVPILNQALADTSAALPPDNTEPLRLELILRAGNPCWLDEPVVSLDEEVLVDGFREGPTATLRREWQQSADTRVEVPDGKLTAIELRVAAEYPLRQLLVPAPTDPTAYKLLLSTSLVPARRCAGLADPLADLAVLLRPVDAKVTGTLQLCADTPAGPGSCLVAPVPFSVTAPYDPAGTWIFLGLPAPLDLAGVPFWLVVTTTEGEGFWMADPDSGEQTAIRKGRNPWLTPSDTTLCGRWRIFGPAPVPPVTHVRLTRGGQHADHPVPPGGFLPLNASDVENLEEAGELVIEPYAQPDTAATFTLSELRLLVAPVAGAQFAW